MTLREQMEAAAATEAEKKKEQTAKWHARDLEQKQRLVARTFGQPTGGQVKRLESSGMETEYAIQPGTVVEVTRQRAVVDGITFGYKSERSGGYYLAPVLVCPECGETHLGDSFYAHQQGPGKWGISDYTLAAVAAELKRQRAKDHKCYQHGTYRVAAAAREGADKLKGITPRELLARADAYLVEKGEW